MRSGLLSKVAAFACASMLVLGGLCLPTIAVAEETPNDLNQLQTDVDALVAKVEETTAAYQEAEETVASLEEQITANEARTAELEQAIPAQRERTAASIKDMYMLEQSSGSLLSLILSAEDFDEFLSAMRYTDAIHGRNVEEINNLTSMVNELAQTNAHLQLQRNEAQKKQEDARAALEEARNARAELQARAIAVAFSEQDNREAAIRVAQEALATTDAATFVTSSGNVATIEVPESSSISTDPLVSNITSSENSDWAARINEYLAGSPLEGYGETFAAAAAQYGVDPRLSPAISTIESGKGSVCFQDYNAWGWGNSSYTDWESAIYDQVAGLASGYDGTLTLEGAERYCPPNYQEWYSSVASEMDGI